MDSGKKGQGAGQRKVVWVGQENRRSREGKGGGYIILVEKRG